MKRHLIIGGGLAGCSLAWRLIQNGEQVCLIDNKKNKSSSIAAGMINPIVFRRVTKSWRIDEFLPEAVKFYQDLERTTQCKFFTEIKIRRFFASDQEKKYWDEKQKTTEYEKYLSPSGNHNKPYSKPDKKWGSGIVKNAYRVDSVYFMKEIHALLLSSKSLKYESFDQDQLNPHQLTYKNERYDSVVFCCGSDQDRIPYFNRVEIQHTKGQLLTINSRDMTEKETWNHKGFILPTGPNLFKVGATIERGARDINITKVGKENLIRVLEGLFSGSYEVSKQVAGIRPTVYDRRPVLGQHQEHKGLYIFNGLGTKGYLMAPLLAHEMMHFILSGKPLNKEVQLIRFNKKER